MFKKYIILSIALILGVSVSVTAVKAQSLIKPDTINNIEDSASTLSNAAGYSEATSDDAALYLVQTVINIFLSVIGVLLLAYLLYAGYNWMTAQGEEEKVERAKDTIKRAIVGIIIIVAAYAISVFVMSWIEQGTLKEGTNSSPSGIRATPTP